MHVEPIDQTLGALGLLIIYDQPRVLWLVRVAEDASM